MSANMHVLIPFDVTEIHKIENFIGVYCYNEIADCKLCFTILFKDKKYADEFYKKLMDNYNKKENIDIELNLKNFCAIKNLKIGVYEDVYYNLIGAGKDEEI